VPYVVKALDPQGPRNESIPGAYCSGKHAACEKWGVSP
jgi:hypothetical protein